MISPNYPSLEFSMQKECVYCIGYSNFIIIIWAQLCALSPIKDMNHAFILPFSGYIFLNPKSNLEQLTLKDRIILCYAMACSFSIYNKHKSIVPFTIISLEFYL